jgi:hypothetical protein
MSNGSGKAKTLGVFALAMINVAAVLSLRNYPSMAVYGWSSIGWYVIGTIAFFFPLTLAGPAITGAIQGAGLQTCAEGDLNWNLTAGFVEGKSIDVDTDCAAYDPNRPGARIHIARFDSAAARDAALRDFETTYRRHIGPAIGRAVGPWLILVDGQRTMPALERLRAALGELAGQ